MLKLIAENLRNLLSGLAALVQGGDLQQDFQPVRVRAKAPSRQQQQLRRR